MKEESGKADPQDARLRKQFFPRFLLQFIPQLLRPEGQGDVLPPLTVSVADDPRLPVVAAVGVGRVMSIDHQDPNPPFGEEIACRHPDGSGTDDDHVIAFSHVGSSFRVKNPAKG